MSVKRYTAVRLPSYRFVAVHTSQIVRAPSLNRTTVSMARQDTKNVVEIAEFLMGHKPENSYIYICIIYR